MADYHNLSQELQERIREDRKKHWINPNAFQEEKVIRRKMDHDRANLWRPAFVRDCEKILHNPYYNRYSDKTQVLSGYQNDDISRRAFHVQLVSRIARNIGQLLGLNVDLIEAVSLGHDIGHTPFGHAGERFLNKIYHEHTGRFFNHNVQSVRVLDKMVNWNISLQVLDGVLCHNGEMRMSEYRPVSLESFEEFDARVESCYTDEEANKKQVPSTLEGCVMRVSDIIAYLGKDRQDAKKVGILSSDEVFSLGEIGSTNAEIINNMIVNIVENSYGKDFLCMEPAYYQAFSRAKKENYEWIYKNPQVDSIYDNVRPMFEAVYEALLSQAKAHDRNSILYKHHVEYLKKDVKFQEKYLEEDPNQVVVDFIASMTDDYLIALYRELFPKGKYGVAFRGYFE